VELFGKKGEVLGGVLAEKLGRHLVGEHWEWVIGVMERFKLAIAKPELEEHQAAAASATTQPVVKDERVWIVPALLPFEDLSLDVLFAEEKPKCRLCSFVFDDQMPEGFFQLFQVCVIDGTKLFSSSPRLTKTRCRFHFGRSRICWVSNSAEEMFEVLPGTIRCTRPAKRLDLHLVEDVCGMDSVLKNMHRFFLEAMAAASRSMKNVGFELRIHCYGGVDPSSRSFTLIEVQRMRDSSDESLRQQYANEFAWLVGKFEAPANRPAAAQGGAPQPTSQPPVPAISPPPRPGGGDWLWQVFGSMRYLDGRAKQEALLLQERLALRGVHLHIITPAPGQNISDAVFATMKRCQGFIAFGCARYGENTPNPVCTKKEVDLWENCCSLQGPMILLRMIPRDQEFPHLTAERIFGMNHLDLDWLEGEDIPDGVVPGILKALEEWST